MCRIYVKKDDEWNIYTTNYDDFLFDKWLDFEDLKIFVIGEMVNNKIMELESLLTNKPILNFMTYEELKEECDIEGKDNE